MKKLQLLGTGLLAVGMLCACTDSKQQAVAEFSTDFATKAQANQLDSLRAVYPLLESADSVYVNFSADSLKVEKAGDGLYRVIFNSASSMVVSYAEDGTMTVKESTGVLAWPAQRVAFAKAIGGIKGEMNDSAMSIVMDNLDGVQAALVGDYINARMGAIKVSGPKITKDIEFMMDEGRGYYTLTNTTDTDIKGDEYVINESYDFMHMGVDSHRTGTVKGKDIPAKGSIKHSFSFSGHGGTSVDGVTMKTPTAEQFMANYKPKGDEWDNYIKAHPEAMRPTAEKLANGPYEITGKLGGKYAITMYLNEGMKDGKYFYDSKGEINSLTLSVKSFNPRTGAIILEETAPDGKVTGTFTGTLSKNAFKGTMSAFTGKTYDFDLAVK